jgi:hypothetical protein
MDRQWVDSEQWTVKSVDRRSSWSELVLGDSKREGPVGVPVGHMSCEDSRSSGLGKLQVSDRLYAEVLFWCARPTTRRWIVLTCVWRVPDCKNVSSCWRSWKTDAHVCSESCWFCSTVVCWVWSGNKHPSWIEPPVRYSILLYEVSKHT